MGKPELSSWTTGGVEEAGRPVAGEMRRRRGCRRGRRGGAGEEHPRQGCELRVYVAICFCSAARSGIDGEKNNSRNRGLELAGGILPVKTVRRESASPKMLRGEIREIDPDQFLLEAFFTHDLD